MKKITLAVCLSLISAVPAIAQNANEIEGAFIACEGVRRACPRTPTPTECTPERVESCRVVEDAWKAIQEDKKASHHATSIDGVAERLRAQKAKK